MQAKDGLRSERNRIRWSRIDPNLPPGIHEPKLDGDVGWDIEAMENVEIGPMESADVAVNARLWLPPGFYADIRNRSSMARRGLYVDSNIIDTGYRGRLFVFIRNMRLPKLSHGFTMREKFVISAGERIGQLVFHRVDPVWMSEVTNVDINTVRSESGFGSTGT